MPPEDASPLAVARVLIGSALDLQRDENIVIDTWNHSLPWAAACVTEARRRGAHPLLVLQEESAYWQSIDVVPTIQRWNGIGEHERAALARSQAYLYFPGPSDQPRQRTLPPGKLGAILRGDEAWTEQVRRFQIRSVRCMLGHVSDQQAEHWRVPGAMWRSQLLRGIVQTDYAEVRRAATRAAKMLRHGQVLRVTSANGTDFSMRLKGRRPWIDDGIVDRVDLRAGRNVATAPPGSVVVAVDERSAEGVAIADRPSFLPEGRAEGGQWEMQRGRLLQYFYTGGTDAFEAEFGVAPRGREVVSIFALGLNGHLTGGVPQSEDMEGGSVTIAMGGNTLYGGTNRCSFLSWIVIGEATVGVDGEPLVDRGHLF